MNCLCAEEIDRIKASQASSSNFSKEVDKKFPSCSCESHSVSKYSSGIVGNDEHLYRLMIDPTHFNGDELSPFALDDALTKGLSVLRANDTSLETLLGLGNKQAGEKRLYRGYLKLSSALLREAKLDTQDRAICIYDTALPNQRSHADVCHVQASTKQDKNKARERLRSAIMGAGLHIHVKPN
jgi:hypothetical protein